MAMVVMMVATVTMARVGRVLATAMVEMMVVATMAGMVAMPTATTVL